MFSPITLPSQSWRLQQYLKEEGPTQTSILALASIWANKLRLLWLFGQEEQSWCASFPWGRSPFHLLCELLVTAVALGLCAAGQSWTLCVPILCPQNVIVITRETTQMKVFFISSNPIVTITRWLFPMLPPLWCLLLVFAPQLLHFFWEQHYWILPLWELDGVCCSLR